MNGLTRLDLCAAMFALDRELDADIAQLEQAKGSLTPDQIAERQRYQAAMRARVDRFAMAHVAAVAAGTDEALKGFEKRLLAEDAR